MAAISRPLILPLFGLAVGDAEQFAFAAHGDQTDKIGDPYIGHLARVAGRTSAKIPCLHGILSPVTICEMFQIAWLHDVIEDTPYGSDHLRREVFSERVVHCVYALSNVSGEPYPAFIAGIVTLAPLSAILVKLSDDEDNADPERLARLYEATRTRLLAKYEPSMAMLREAARAKGWQG